MADFYRELITYRDSLARKIEGAEMFLANAPSGYLSCDVTNGKLRYRQKEYGPGRNKKVNYISADDSSLIHELAQKRYYQQLLPIMEKEKGLVDRLVCELDELKKEKCYSDANDYRKCWLKAEYCMPEDYEAMWLARECNHKEITMDVRTIKTRNGENVRSKSEKIIADDLFYSGIPYKYEAELILGGIIIHPDFTVLNKRTGKEYYIEHLGMMDNEDYYNGVVRRLDLYAQNGIYIGDRLLLTYETSHYAINTGQIGYIIEEYLL